MNKELIQALKDNERPFGLMTAEMRDMANDITSWEFEGWNIGPCVGWNKLIGGGFVCESTYRLRPDYKEEPGIIEREITLINNVMHFKEPDKHNQNEVLHWAISRPDFIGFKYENGMVRVDPIAYMPKGGYEGVHHRTEIIGLESGKIEVISATHVLFRRTP